ncbi:hypothetical protein QEH56_06900 [Pelagicoccus enzymogenes]|uniref:hypothetical protein n=1 Tax=Pelagicoccus enzymogenes TaxID=2773457 RepID=UPI00280E342F|nr:hypothetical protein [Pelagicoccus enzymogenes]MDQ8197867.1 hypothetical protein [Pelagicoccus enzymogenes]
MKRALLSILFLGTLTHSANPQEEPSPGSGYYQFYGAEVLVRFKGEAVPIVAAKKKGVFVQNGKRLKRLPWSTLSTIQPQIGVSNRLVSVEDFSYSYFYQSESRWESDAYNSVSSRQRATNLAIAKLSTPGQNPTASQMAQIDELMTEQMDYENQMDTLINDGELKAEGYADSVRMSMTLTPVMDVPGAYCAVLTDYYRADGEHFVVTKTEWLGDLLANIPEEIDFVMKLREGDYSKSRSQFYLFSEDGVPVPTNLSTGLKELSIDELKELANQAQR